MEIVVIQEPVRVEYTCEHCGCAVSIGYREFTEGYVSIDDLDGFEVECDCCGETNIITDTILD